MLLMMKAIPVAAAMLIVGFLGQMLPDELMRQA